ncbi:MAG: tRNA (adenosine(37)-N6)-threonylcarbamoyltransferase complex ATPase subunit type 1 TsaE [Cellulophaga sp.]
MKKKYRQSEIQSIAKELITKFPSKTICFYGNIGAGKTTLIKALIKELGISEAGSSPTFGIVNEYESKEGETLVYHFDFYRIENELEVLDFGLEDYFSSNLWIFIEWPENIANLIPENAASVHINIVSEGIREISMA